MEFSLNTLKPNNSDLFVFSNTLTGSLRNVSAKAWNLIFAKL